MKATDIIRELLCLIDVIDTKQLMQAVALMAPNIHMIFV